MFQSCLSYNLSCFPLPNEFLVREVKTHFFQPILACDDFGIYDRLGGTETKTGSHMTHQMRWGGGSTIPLHCAI